MWWKWNRFFIQFFHFSKKDFSSTHCKNSKIFMSFSKRHLNFLHYQKYPHKALPFPDQPAVEHSQQQTIQVTSGANLRCVCFRYCGNLVCMSKKALEEGKYADKYAGIGGISANKCEWLDKDDPEHPPLKPCFITYYPPSLKSAQICAYVSPL